MSTTWGQIANLARRSIVRTLRQPACVIPPLIFPTLLVFAAVLGQLESVIGSHNKNHNICDLSTTSTHCRKGFVAWGIKERNCSAIRFNGVSTNMLCNSASFARGHIGLTDRIENACLTVINVTHHSDNWGS